MQSWKFSVILFLILNNSCTFSKKIIIIGASSGIGKALAKTFDSPDNVIGIAARRMNLLKELKEELSCQTFVKKIDLNSPTNSRKALTSLIEKMGGLDTIIISSAIWPEIALSEKGGLIPSDKKLPWENEHNTIKVNVTGFAAVANEAINYFLNQNHGHLVGISSVDAARGHASCPTYCASKSFMSTYLEGVRNKLRQSEINTIDITEIRPGYVATYGLQQGAYWVATPEEAAKQIHCAIKNKEKVSFITRRWRLIHWLIMITPDWLYNKIGGI